MEITFEMEQLGNAQHAVFRAGVEQLQALEVTAAGIERRRPARVSSRRVKAPNGGARVAVMLPRFGAPQLSVLLGILFALNVLELRHMVARGPVPDVYRAGVRYHREPRGQEVWRTIAVLYRLKRGDCEDIATALAAWLFVVLGESARPVWRLFQTAAGRLYHIVTERAGGVIEDACRALGMGKDDGRNHDASYARRTRRRRRLYGSAAEEEER